MPSASRYICCRQLQKSPPPCSTRPRSARWKTCEWTLAKPGRTRPLSVVARSGGSLPALTRLICSPSTSITTFCSSRPSQARSAYQRPGSGTAEAKNSGRGSQQPEADGKADRQRVAMREVDGNPRQGRADQGAEAGRCVGDADLAAQVVGAQQRGVDRRADR